MLEQCLSTFRTLLCSLNIVISSRVVPANTVDGEWTRIEQAHVAGCGFLKGHFIQPWLSKVA